MKTKTKYVLAIVPAALAALLILWPRHAIGYLTIFMGFILLIYGSNLAVRVMLIALASVAVFLYGLMPLETLQFCWGAIFISQMFDYIWQLIWFRHNDLANKLSIVMQMMYVAAVFIYGSNSSVTYSAWIIAISTILLVMLIIMLTSATMVIENNR